jgi:hypothetical protein
VRVLEGAVGDIRNLDAEVLVHLRVPCRRDIRGADLAGDHVLLQLEAQDDVQVVGGLVRLDADERGLDR